MSGSVISSGLADTTRIYGHPARDTEGKLATQSCTIASGRRSAQISVSLSCEYSAPSTNSAQIGAVTVANCSMVGRRNCGEVSRTNSAQPPPTASGSGAAWPATYGSGAAWPATSDSGAAWPATYGSDGGGAAIRINRSSKPRLASSPSKDSSMTKTV